jgi:Fur family transcriptional regulator, stress-responsive regulator
VLAPGTQVGQTLTQHQIFDSIQTLIYPNAMSADPADLLRQHGIQVTAQRLAVLRAVASQPHITADGVAEVVRAEIGAISRQSVYDALSVLVAEGLIRRIQPSGSPARFEDRVGDNHHHVICRICGRTADVDCAVGSAPCLTAVDDMGYEIDEAEVIYWGRCPECVSRARDANPLRPNDTPVSKRAENRRQGGSAHPRA